MLRTTLYLKAILICAPQRSRDTSKDMANIVNASELANANIVAFDSTKLEITTITVHADKAHC